MAEDSVDFREDLSLVFSISQLQKVRSEALIAYSNAEIRGLLYTSKWLSELALSLEIDGEEGQGTDILGTGAAVEICKADRTKHVVAMTYYHLKEYKRAEYLTRTCQSLPVQFLHYYCKYMDGESKRSQPELFFDGEQNKEDNREHLVELCSELTDKYKNNELDAYLLYLYGIVLKKSGYTEDAQSVLVKSITLEPCLWSAWFEISTLLNDRNDLSKLQLPDHWMKHFFLAHTYLDLQLSDQSANIYSNLLENGFANSTYVIAQLAMAYDNTKNVDMAVQYFEDLRRKDPYRLDNMDTYSNALYVKDMRVELADLAAKCISIDKYRAETCCVIGNYYSIREQHEHAALYFQRALKLDPNFISAWTLMGHEYMELNNQSAAIQAYRQALEVDSRDFRAWYGLGQTHEILKMHHYSLYYYQQALKLRPNDSRMLMAVGCAYKLLNKPQQAKICFWKAHMIGDPEGIALTHLAKLHETLKEDENAAAAFTKFVLDATQSGITNPKEMAHAYKFLANYNLKIENHDEAYIAAQKCIDYPETREEGKALLNQITKTCGIPDTMGGNSVNLPLNANDSLTEDLFNRTTATPAPHLSPRNLDFIVTPDH